MKFTICIVIISAIFVDCNAISYYNYYAPGGAVTSGLVAEGDSFTLNGKEITIYSGALHYFRVHPSYWRDTLRKLRAAGLNTVETYMPWNLHNPRKDEYDFGDLGEDMSLFLNLQRFLTLAQEEDLFVILRPGPYICSEWDFGGMPSWLLRDYTMSVRSSYDGFVSSIIGYYELLTSIASAMTFQKGGPIIAVQIENEYGAFGYEDQPRDKRYLETIRQLFDDNGMSDALYVTSDTPSNSFDWGALPGVLMTANFQEGVDLNLDTLKEIQPDRPLMVMEYWTGWFDHWLEPVHVSVPASQIDQNLREILNKSSSVNFYMFIGGTNFGFMAGANIVETSSMLEYTPIVTSYDYDAPLTEAGDYSKKYDNIRATLAEYNLLTGIVTHPPKPAIRAKHAYGAFDIQEAIEFQDLVKLFPYTEVVSNGPISMEELNINNGSGQSYGYVLYSTTKELPTGSSTILIRGHVRDMAQVLVNGVVATERVTFPNTMHGFGLWNGRDEELTFDVASGGNVTIDILVENLGRVNYGKPHFFYQKKGLWEGPVLINQEQINDWNITPMEFKKKFITESLDGWQDFTQTGSFDTPSLYRVTVPMDGGLFDTFLDMKDWGKGVVFVNGFNIGRYWDAGPTRTLYVPAPLLRTGDNEIVIFEQYSAPNSIIFTDSPNLGLLG